MQHTIDGARSSQIRQCDDDNPKIYKCTYKVTLYGREIERTYLLCHKCREDPVFAQGIVKEEFIRPDDPATGNIESGRNERIVDITDSNVIPYYGKGFRSVSPTLVVDYKPPRNSQYRSSEVLS